MTGSGPAPGSQNLHGALLMLAATVLMAMAHALIRHISEEIHAFEVAFFRNLVTLLVMAPLIWRQGRSAFRGARHGLQALRGVLGASSMLCWFLSLQLMPIADATALNFTSAIFVTIGAALILAEPVGMRRWAAVLAGFAGALIVIRPGFAEVGTGAIMTLGASVLWAGSLILVKILARTDSTVTILFFSGLYFTPLSLVAALFVWQWPTAEQLALLLLIGALATTAHYFLTSAFRTTEATVVMPIDYARLIWTALLGHLFFREFPDVWTWIGGSVIFASVIYITYRESEAAKRLTGAPERRT